ncbi:hypothetical protein CYMTET_12141 [Cymbomonas tetramitiformis]|uniref:Uncharacterized protein n=1 Tax=Cymbomonas tetramitiformis TaxID=36881 RepID=A0AAE0GL26_9CHLO|nr:hypothetical protein CYMTET_12141 [Cymbomonas tetramitiformis]
MIRLSRQRAWCWVGSPSIRLIKAKSLVRGGVSDTLIKAKSPGARGQPWDACQGKEPGVRWAALDTLIKAKSLLIWKEAEFRATSLKRAEAGLGDTVWTARTRRLTPKSITPTSKFPDDEKDEAL